MTNGVLQGKSAVVTGAGGGIGRAVAVALAEQGAGVVVNDIAVEDTSGARVYAADETVKEILSRGGSAVASYDSVADYESAGRIIQSSVDAFGSIDILANFAGGLASRPFLELSPDEWDSMLRLNLYGTFYCCRHAGVHMRERGYGRIINVASEAYVCGLPGDVGYSAAKGGVVSLTRTVAHELAGDGITCNCLLPVAASGHPGGPAIDPRPDPSFVAPLVVYLCSDQGASISGGVLGCAGGKISVYSEPSEVRAIYKDHLADGPWTMEEMGRVMPTAIAPFCRPPQPVFGTWT